MTRPRKELVSPKETPFYHVVSRCVRRAFLCGFDHENQQDYEHRRQWIESRIRILSSLFSIDVCAYAVMSNHYHIVVKLVPERVDLWSDNDVISRWTALFNPPLLIKRQQKGMLLSLAEQNTVDEIIHIWRHRLSSLSWFMKCLNEPIARQANKEDNCTGHFWESRYKSQALATEEALLSCMAYVDLNPMRAGVAETPEASDYTSIKKRVSVLSQLKNRVDYTSNKANVQQSPIHITPLLHFDGHITHKTQTGIPFDFRDYLTLIDWTGRVIRQDKRGAISQQLPPILKRLGVDRNRWLKNSCQFERYYQYQFRRKPPEVQITN